MSNFKQKLKNKFVEYGFNLSDLQAQRFCDYYSLLLEWNSKFNLTSIIDEDDVIIKHFIDSVLPAERFKENAKIIDIGTGAGFPGVPIKIMRDDINMTLLDSLKKRTVFLEEVVRVLGLQGVRVVHSRAETYAKGDSSKNYDYCLSRAVAKINTLVELGAGLVSVGGKVVSYKSDNIDEELKNAENAIKILGLTLSAVYVYEIKELNAKRKIVFYEKIKGTPAAYPRGKDKPRKSPL